MNINDISKENFYDLIDGFLFGVDDDDNAIMPEDERLKNIGKLVQKAAEWKMKTEVRKYLEGKEKRFKKELEAAERNKHYCYEKGQRQKAAENDETLIVCEDFFITNDKGKPCKAIDENIANAIKAKTDIRIISLKPWFYDKGYWKQDSDCIILRGLISRCLPKELNNANTVKRIMELVLYDAEIQKDFSTMNNYPDHWVCFADCMLDLKTFETHEHDKRYYCINKIPFNVIPILEDFEGMIELWEGSDLKRFIETTIPDEGDRLMWATNTAYSMTKDNDLQKMMLVTGPGGTGKSTLLKLNSILFGKDNISNIALQNLTGDRGRFTLSGLIGKLVNICSDLDRTLIKDPGVIKQITGGDQIQGEYKGGKIFWFTPNVRLWFSCNELPPVNDCSDAFARRMMILKIDHRGEYIPNLRESVENAAALYLVYILKAWKDHWQDLTERAQSKNISLKNGVFSSPRGDSFVEVYLHDSDIVGQFLEERVILDRKERTNRKDLYDAFDNWLWLNHMKSMSNRYLFNTLRTKGFEEIKSCGSRYFIGLRLL